MKIVCISDTHSLHKQITVPEGDVLVHAGDLTSMGTRNETELAIAWLNDQPCTHVVCIAGNHDFALESKTPPWFSDFDWGRVKYLENTGTMINGQLFYGSPVTPWFCDWAFNVHRGAAIKEYWDMIPAETKVLLTHGPPFGILDQSKPLLTDHLGCDDLLDRVAQLTLKLHVFGHIHGSYGVDDNTQGVIFVNASQVNEAYKVTNKPIVLEI